MPIDQARLARIRTRVLAAAALAASGCGGPQHVNTAPPDHTVNEPANPTPDATPPPATPETVNTPPSDPPK